MLVPAASLARIESRRFARSNSPAYTFEIVSTVSPACLATSTTSRPAAIHRLIAVCLRECVVTFGRPSRFSPAALAALSIPRAETLRK